MAVNIQFDPSSGSQNQTVKVSGNCNPGIDETIQFQVQTEDGSKTEIINVTQEGKREVFMVSDGQGGYTEFTPSDGGTYNVVKEEWKDTPDCHDTFMIGTLTKGQTDPAFMAVYGDASRVPELRYALIDTTSDDGSGNPITPVGRLNKNNFLRYSDGTFAPTVGITEAQRAECDVELYLDNAGQHKYCDAGAFNAEDFYNEHGMAKLYNAEGTEVRVLRPWETTETKYTIGAFFSEDVYLIDNILDEDGSTVYRGITKTLDVNDGEFSKTFSADNCFKLPVTAISPGPFCTVGNKARSFFFDYEGETSNQSAGGFRGYCTMFQNGRTYPRYSVSQLTTNTYARANNQNADSSFPFSEGGYFARNVFVNYIELKYGTRNINNNNLFGSGISSSVIPNADNIESVGGVRFKFEDANDWTYVSFGSSMSSYIYDYEYNASYFLNSHTPKEQCMESQMAYSFAQELSVPENTWFTFYGEEYKYSYVGGENQDMAAIVIKKMTGTATVPVSESENKTMDIEVYLRMSLFDGLNLMGDVFRYTGGGYEQVVVINNQQETSRFGNDMSVYLCPDQDKFINLSTVYNDDGSQFDFENGTDYRKLKEFTTTRNHYILDRESNTGVPEDSSENASNVNYGECAYFYVENYWRDVIGSRARAGARFGGASAYGTCSARYLYAAHLVSNTSTAYAGSAQVRVTAV